MTYKKKLIEVALPLDAINEQSAREKSIRHGHPSTLHLWWARRPLAACRAVLFASLVDDPSSNPKLFPTEKDQDRERERLFDIIREMVKWENTTNKALFKKAHEEILKSTDGNPPPVLDPFCGGGSIPLEAQRLGLEAHASDLNPVAVLITKALIEIPPKFAGKEPVNPEWQKTSKQEKAATPWEGAQGLAEDVRYYGTWMRDEAFKRIGHLYPKVKLPKENGGREATVIAWLWARTVKCPNPACGAQMPLVTSFWLSKKKGSETWVEPIINQKKKSVEFTVKTGKGIPSDPPKVGRGAKFKCMVCGDPSEDSHIKLEGMQGRMNAQMMAIICESEKGRVYIAPDKKHEQIAFSEKPTWKPEQQLAGDKRAIWCPLYGLDTFDKLFTSRQLIALTTFSDLVSEIHKKIIKDAINAGMKNDSLGIEDSGLGAKAYADAVATYLAFGVSRGANYWSSLNFWGGEFIVQTFGRQALPMVWDYAECNLFSSSTGNWQGAIDWITRCLLRLTSIPEFGYVKQLNATSSINGINKPIICTDPPYYDNIGYADLADYFYVWLRKSIHHIYPDLLSTLLTPKAEELVATPYRFDGNKKTAEKFFEDGLRSAFQRMRESSQDDFPFTIFYAFKQAENVSENDIVSAISTGWETMLEGLLKSGFTICGTWPLRTERDQGLKTGTNVLASSVVLVVRPKPEDAPLATRKEFINELKKDMPDAIKKLTKANIAPVDLAQSAIGPGMAVFSRYSKVLETDGTKMAVRTALGLINQALDEILTEQEGDFDSETRWAIAWFEQHGQETGPYGVAETLSKAKDVGIDGLVKSGILESKAGKVRLLRREELNPKWDPKSDERITVWEVTQHLIRKHQDGDAKAADLLRKVGSLGESAHDLVYRLYQICERKKWSQEALAYNSLAISWQQISDLAQKGKDKVPGQGKLFE